MDTIAAIVGALDNRALFGPIISHTALQHERFGVTLSQLTAFGDALMEFGTVDKNADGLFCPQHAVTSYWFARASWRPLGITDVPGRE